MAQVISQAQAPAIATSMMASLYGAVRTWDDSITLTDLFGYSGHAFILNIERTLCPSGPTAWDWGAILFPLRQMFSLRRLCATCDMRSTEEARELIWQRTVESIDAGHPAILWDAIMPEFYLAHGYDDVTGEYLVQGPLADRVSGRVSWAKLGSNSGQVWALFPGPNDERDITVARDLALRGAVTWHRWPNDPDTQWTFGGDAWDVWIAALSEEELAHDSAAISLNHLVYAECRRHAADFLTAQGPEFAEAATAYARVADALQALCTAWPYPTPIPSLAVRRELAQHLAEARDAEAEGVQALDAILEQQKAARI
ncbi:MAG TPA: hypothetical protein VGL77_07825 [Armatimonadota bacterium]|jgi:hypothetical protein